MVYRKGSCRENPLAPCFVKQDGGGHGSVQRFYPLRRNGDIQRPIAQALAYAARLTADNQSASLREIDIRHPAARGSCRKHLNEILFQRIADLESFEAIEKGHAKQRPRRSTQSFGIERAHGAFSEHNAGRSEE